MKPCFTHSLIFLSQAAKVDAALAHVGLLKAAIVFAQLRLVAAFYPGAAAQGHFGRDHIRRGLAPLPHIAPDIEKAGVHGGTRDFLISTSKIQWALLVSANAKTSGFEGLLDRGDEFVMRDRAPGLTRPWRGNLANVFEVRMGSAAVKDEVGCATLNDQ